MNTVLVFTKLKAYEPKAAGDNTYFPSNMVWLMVTIYPAPPTSKYGAVRVTWPGNSIALVYLEETFTCC